MNAAAITAIIKKQPIGFACGVICLVCGLLLYFRNDAIAENQKTYDERSAKADEMENNVRNAKDLPAQVAAMQAASKEFESRLVRASQLALNYRYFYRLVDEAGVKLSGDVRQGALPAATAGAKGLYQGVPYNVTVQGPFHRVLNFLQRLESAGRFCRFNTVNLTKVGSQTGSGADDMMNAALTIDLLGVP